MWIEFVITLATLLIGGAVFILLVLWIAALFKLERRSIQLERIAKATERIAAFFEFFETAWAEADEITAEDEK